MSKKMINSWANVARQATIYFQVKDIKESSGAILLTSGSDVRKPEHSLLGQKVHIKAGRFWISNMPELFINNQYEAYLEVNAVCVSEAVLVPHPFKLKVDVKKDSFSSEIANRRMIANAEVIGDGIEFQIRLTELDKINQDKFKALKDFVDDNDLPGIAQGILKSLPVNPKEAVKLIFNAVELIDNLNDDDRIWIEKPILDFHHGTNSPLYAGSYAIVATPKDSGEELPIHLYESGGVLYKEYTDSTNNVPFKNETYFTFYVFSSNLLE